MTLYDMLSTGPSDLNVILGIITDFLHKPYNSIEDPLDLWFHQLPAGTLIAPFSIGYSVRFGKASAALSILHAIIRLRSSGGMGDAETDLIGPHIAALLSIKSMTDPATTIEEQVGKTIAKKFRVTDRPRPHALQLYSAFCKVMEFKRARPIYLPHPFMLSLIGRIGDPDGALRVVFFVGCFETSPSFPVS